MALSPEFKIILLGDPGVGKTTYFLRLKEGDYVDTELRPTASLGVEHLERTIKVDGADVKVRTGTALEISHRPRGWLHAKSPVTLYVARSTRFAGERFHAGVALAFTRVRFYLPVYIIVAPSRTEHGQLKCG